MGIGLNVISLYQRMHQEGLFQDIKKVIDLGSQNLNIHEDLNYIDKFSNQITGKNPSENLYRTIKALGGARVLYEELGFKYDFIIDGNVVNEKYIHEFMQHHDITRFKATQLIREIYARIVRRLFRLK